ncbi:efflux RND transporter periplasmic adaptor subunit [Roseibium alexandrii]|uniref:Cation efflux system protein CusB n=1 Tax=Roseibium alexandrii TaxID=388408 RepID=A0A0M7A3P3_9HYPH|nr:efflux RND transporter periplasmic adaptor subunit [Roseibium alexandrii]CTQ69678.1 Cation efflux system protein CusB precursor [Roseibium alexandrii]
MRGRYSALSILALAAGVAGGVFLERLYLNPAGDTASGEDEILYWVAPMDPNFRQPGPGKSPMGMDLVPVYAGQEPSGDPAEVQLSAAEINAIGVRTALARVAEISQKIETVGFVGYDEHLTSHVHTRVDGWIETLNVRAVGDQVKKGEILFELFSPEFGVASFDFLRSLENGNGLSLEAARNKLRSHGASELQIAEIERTGEVARSIQVVAPRDGVVIALSAADGMFLQPGTQAMSITNLDEVWLIVDVFERDIARLSKDMRAIARFEHLPGQTFEGAIDYIYPELDAKTRTLPVRLRFDNSDGQLRPNMFGNVTLVPQATRMAVTAPTEAVIRTGAAERVIIKVAEGTFKPRLITTGLRDNFGDGGRTEIVQGLAPGEEVVASAQFLIDSESALSAGLMRMAPTNEAPAPGTGELIALDRATRMATIRHDALDSLDWPAMTSTFPVQAGMSLDRVTDGQMVAFQAVRGADGLLGLTELGSDDGIAATGTGTVLAVTPDGKLTLDHGPIPELGWPAMKMDLDVADLDPSTVPLDVPVEFDLSKDDGGMFSVVAVRETGADKISGTDEEAETDPETEASDAAPPIVVSGKIDAIDPDAGKATITHGPIAEIGMPGMTMAFDMDPALDLETLPLGTETTLTFDRPDGMTMVLAKAEPVSPPMEVRGTINEIDADAKTANITHGPMTEIGMPGMTMDFTLDPALSPTDLPLSQEVTLLLRRNPDFSMTLIGTRSEEAM